MNWDRVEGEFKQRRREALSLRDNGLNDELAGIT